jgi:hypothetical protein
VFFQKFLKLIHTLWLDKDPISRPSLKVGNSMELSKHKLRPALHEYNKNVVRLRELFYPIFYHTILRSNDKSLLLKPSLHFLKTIKVFHYLKFLMKKYSLHFILKDQQICIKVSLFG